MKELSREANLGELTAAVRRGTPAARYRQMIIGLAAIPAPPSPSAYDSRAECGHILFEHVGYLRSLVDTLASAFERCADDAADFGGARSESFDIVRAAAEDFLAPISEAANTLTDV